ncbi:hypothetical protein K437DRAFT_270817 [Tilletiaria anomala UBC 951]|uniref:YTH domain-containing protein n=1 Tax=Tilletiaria anomala (strain ATCC 24038 / CBS 436.72 / UBC 951) TaxID=1037660 RepID=A0A066VFP1_TILAU|nr:uncharacterized protein K437DRAFT_270817 [Tilletiaria anomala UBC 951]KDN37589.1 hypothetical protein K437DRAFT_270817 [Tilletiaria anomala UBC 951]
MDDSLCLPSAGAAQPSSREEELQAGVNFGGVGYAPYMWTSLDAAHHHQQQEHHHYTGYPYAGSRMQAESAFGNASAGMFSYHQYPVSPLISGAGTNGGVGGGAAQRQGSHGSAGAMQETYYDVYGRLAGATHAAAPDQAVGAPFVGYMYGYPFQPGMPGVGYEGTAESLNSVQDDGSASQQQAAGGAARCSTSSREGMEAPAYFQYSAYAPGYDGLPVAPPGFLVHAPGLAAAAAAAARGAPGMPCMAASAFHVHTPNGFGMGTVGFAPGAMGSVLARPPPRQLWGTGRGRGQSSTSRGGPNLGSLHSLRMRPRQSSATSASGNKPITDPASSPIDSPPTIAEGVQPLSTSTSSSSQHSPLHAPHLSGMPAESAAIAPHLPRPPSRLQDPNSQPQRSDHVMWVGNIPTDATIPELWQFFGRLPPAESGTTPPAKPAGLPAALPQQAAIAGAEVADPGAAAPPHGILSIFIISRSNCAFVNYKDAEVLQRAVAFFAGQALRPLDPHCPRLVCRVRRKDEEVQAGVAGQRGKGFHIAYIKEHEKRRKEDVRLGQGQGTAAGENTAIEVTLAGSVTSLNLEDSNMKRSEPGSPRSESTGGTPRQLPADARLPGVSQAEPPALAYDGSSGSPSVSSGSLSYTSTNSSLLRHPAFKERFFVLKSHQVEELQRSVEKGIWATQLHNEDVLDRAFRNSQSVYLFFSANQSGGWFGVARMMGPIKPHPSTPKLEHSPLMSKRGGHPNRPKTIFEEGTDAQGDQIKSRFAPTSFLSALGDRTSSELQPIASPNDITKLNEEEMPLSWAPGAGGSSASTSVPESNRRLLSPDVGGISCKDMLGEQLPGSECGSISGGSIYPADSVSMASTARDLQQLAVRALIHNLRLDERESSQKASELEYMLEAGAEGLPSRPAQAIGRPFKVEWIQVRHVPFYVTRKLRNPWRDNRQVKVSRDGTELEPSVGREMLEIFDKFEDREKTAAATSGDRNTSPEQDQEDEENSRNCLLPGVYHM